MSQPYVDHDPLLEFSVEPGAMPPPAPFPAEPSQPVAAPIVPAATSVADDAEDDIEKLRARIHLLEQAADQSAKELREMKVQVATLVGPIKHIKRPAHPVWLPVASAIAGVAIGVATGVCIWMHIGSEQVAPPAPVAAVGEPVRESLPVPQSIVAPPQPSIVHAAAITPVSTAPARVAPPRVGAPPLNYVGTLSIDADPAGDVFIDRKAAGKTPMRAENLKAGSHLVWIERDGYRRFTRVVQVPSGRVTRLVADLEPAKD